VTFWGLATVLATFENLGDFSNLLVTQMTNSLFGKMKEMTILKDVRSTLLKPMHSFF
jgi:hypothetical protein